MQKFTEQVTYKIEELIKLYESYIRYDESLKLDVIIQDKIIWFLLHNNEKKVDELMLEFDKSDSKIFTVLSINTFILLLGDVIIHHEDYVYYNNIHKNYLRVTVLDNKIKNVIDKLVENQHKEFINFNNKLVKEHDAFIKNMIFRRRFLDVMDERIEYSRKLLRDEYK